MDVAVAAKVGDDAFGDFLVALLDERGIERSAVVRDAAVPTSATVVLVAADGERTFLHRLGASGALRRDEFAPAQLFSARALHVAGALVMPALDGEPTSLVRR